MIMQSYHTQSWKYACIYISAIYGDGVHGYEDQHTAKNHQIV